ncbi:unnamed protein product [Candida verbasci]|uniref:Inclusion body clearance protein IML2 n=1 Tax=Candida verbasci TaxID=1227364 RepID=A0A9W4X9K2_9ASCO|nr:unnamed protein product [Candida verbasci]
MLKGLRKKASILSLTSTQSNSSSNSSSHVNPSNNNNNNDYERVVNQVHDFEIALKAMDYLLDDKTRQGTELLKHESINHKTNSDQPHAIFPLALGVMEFIEATLGFEPEVMAKAHKTLSEAENSSLNNSKFNAKHQLSTSLIYPPGTEFQVTYAESTLLNALLMLLTENNGMVESAKALFKLRKAYQTLDAVYKKIKESEPIFNKNLAKIKKEFNKSKGDGIINLPNHSISTVDLPGYNSQTSSSSSIPQDLKLIKDLEKVYMMRKARVEGTNLGNNRNKPINLFEDSNSSVTLAKQHQIRDKDIDNSDDDEFVDALEHLDIDYTANSSQFLNSSTQSILSSIETSPSESQGSQISENNHLHVSTIDEFIHSGVQLCFGVLQVVLSLIPPAIGKVLSIVGFKGDREVGLKLLWRTAITSRNIHGELALLFLLVFYDGPVQFVDNGFQLPNSNNNKTILNLENKSTVSESELSKILENPSDYTSQLLKRARSFFPNNALWVLQEGRMLAAEGELYRASELMQNFTDDLNNKIQMQQVEALLTFDRATIYMYQHRYDEAAKDLIYLIDINSWSKAVYLFMAASCYCEKYRMIKMDVVKSENKSQDLNKYSKLFEKYLNLSLSYVPGYGTNAQKKGGLGGSGKQMPFDKFLLRKAKHIENNKKLHPNLPIVDVVGTSLVHELIYFWNGYNRMTEPELVITLKMLTYSGASNSEYSANSTSSSYSLIEETEDEAMIRYFLQAITLRQLGRVKEGLKILDSQVISKYVISDSPQFKFTKLTYSPYLYPTAIYEKCMFVWLLETRKHGSIDIKQAVHDSKSWLKKAEIVGEGDYELSNRTNMRIKAAGDRLDQLGNI